MTYFFIKPPDSIEGADYSRGGKANESAQVRYFPDDSAMAKVKRKFVGGLGEAGKSPMISSGGDGFDSVPAIVSKINDSEKLQVVAKISKTAKGLTFQVVVSFLWDPSKEELESHSLVLIVELERNVRSTSNFFSEG